MKNSKTKTKRLRHVHAVLRRIERRLFDVFSKTFAELDQTISAVEQGLKEARKKS